MKWLSFGERTEHPGALRVDIRPVADQVQDIRRLTFRDNLFDGVECFHILEHLDPDDAVRAARELYRVLKPGGVLEVAVPDLVKCSQLILTGNTEILMNVYSPHREEAQRHRWGYTPTTLLLLLERVGFAMIKELPSPVDPNEVRMRAIKP